AIEMGFGSRSFWRRRRQPCASCSGLARILAIPGVERRGVAVATVVHVDGRGKFERGVLVPASQRVRMDVIALTRNDAIWNELGHDLQRASLLVTGASKHEIGGAKKSGRVYPFLGFNGLTVKGFNGWKG